MHFVYDGGGDLYMSVIHKALETMLFVDILQLPLKLRSTMGTWTDFLLFGLCVGSEYTSAAQSQFAQTQADLPHVDLIRFHHLLARQPRRAIRYHPWDFDRIPDVQDNAS